MDIAHKENTEIEDRTIDSHEKNSKKIQKGRREIFSN